MKHGEEEDDTGSGSAAAMVDGAAAAAIKHQALRLAEDLSLPTVQVVVMSANMGCSHCRQRVTKVVSRMNGLLDYMVDFGNKEVTVRGTIMLTKKKKNKPHKKHKNGVTDTTSLSSPSPSPSSSSASSSSSPSESSWPLSYFLGCYGS